MKFARLSIIALAFLATGLSACTTPTAPIEYRDGQSDGNSGGNVGGGGGGGFGGPDSFGVSPPGPDPVPGPGIKI